MSSSRKLKNHRLSNLFQKPFFKGRVATAECVFYLAVSTASFEQVARWTKKASVCGCKSTCPWSLYKFGPHSSFVWLCTKERRGKTSRRVTYKNNNKNRQTKEKEKQKGKCYKYRLILTHLRAKDK